MTDWGKLQQHLLRAGERRLVLLLGERPQALRWLADTLPGLTVRHGLWQGPAADCPLPSLTPIASDAGRQWLGRELDLLVWDGWQGNPPDSLAALAGTLCAGGLWFWMMPPLEQWGRFDDPDYRRTGLADSPQHPFAARCAQILAQHPGVLRVELGAGSQAPFATPPQPDTPFCIQTTDEQQQAVARIIKVGRGRRRRPLVLTADRGRGKSAALGMAAAQLRAEGVGPILVTAPQQQAVATLLAHAGHPPGLEFVAVDALLRERPAASLVLVDEAAAIPAPQLKAILSHWPRVVFASTIHGYEGAGRGFALRFRQVLDALTPQWQRLHLNQPIRWVQGDPLEALINRLFLLDADHAPEAADAPLRIAPWRPADASEPELAQVFGLLVNAHYRTSPADLRQWLDDAASRTWLAWAGDQPVGVLWLVREGGLEPELAAPVMRGERRIRGHLLPQSLANHSGFSEAVGLRGARVVRIAVHESARQQGIGKALVRAARDYGQQQALDWLGTSFGGEPGLLAFWHQCGLLPVRLGLHQEASSGEYTLQMLQPLSAPGEQLVTAIRQRFAWHWPVLLGQVWQTLNPELVAGVTARLPAPAELDQHDWRELQAFSDGYRGFELSLLPLQRLSAQPGVMARLATQPDLALWCRAVLQRHDWPALQQAGLCVGRKDGEGRLRQLATLAMAAAGTRQL